MYACYQHKVKQIGNAEQQITSIESEIADLADNEVVNKLIYVDALQGAKERLRTIVLENDDMQQEVAQRTTLALWFRHVVNEEVCVKNMLPRSDQKESNGLREDSWLY